MVEEKMLAGAERLFPFLNGAINGDGPASADLVDLLTEECRARCEGKRYFPISLMREACRRDLRELALDVRGMLVFYEAFSDAVLAALAGSGKPEAARVGRALQDTVSELKRTDQTKALLLRLQYVVGLNWDEIRVLPSAAHIAAPEKAFVALGAELQARGLSPEILVQQNLRPRGEVTQLLENVRDGQRPLGDVVAHERLRLHRQAEHMLKREGGNISLQADDLVNEMFLRIPKDPNKSPANHMEFDALTKRIMRHILIDRARKPIPGQGRYSDELNENLFPAPSNVENRLNWENVMQIVDEVILEERRGNPESAAILRATLYSDVDQKELARLYDVSVSTVKRRVKEGRNKIRKRLGLESKP